jgi:hypothetical protein
MTPAEQIRAQVEWYVQCLKDVQAGKVVRGLGEAEAGYHSALAALAALEAEHAEAQAQRIDAERYIADRVWLTRDEAKRARAFARKIIHGEADWLAALLDERIGDKPTSIRAMIDKE